MLPNDPAGARADALAPAAPSRPTDPPSTVRTAILWCNLGSPDAPTAQAVRPYLSQFLHDHRVVEIPRAIWCLILHGIILRVRPAKSAAKYASIWLAEGSPLKVWTARQATLLAGWLGERGHRLTVRAAMRYANPSIGSQLDALQAEGIARVLVLQAYPQYSATTTASVIDAVAQWTRTQRRLQPGAVLVHRMRRVAHVIAEIERIPGRGADAAPARGAQRMHARRCGPVRLQPFGKGIVGVH